MLNCRNLIFTVMTDRKNIHTVQKNTEKGEEVGTFKNDCLGAQLPKKQTRSSRLLHRECYKIRVLIHRFQKLIIQIIYHFSTCY